jgi:hypothetical protein
MRLLCHCVLVGKDGVLGIALRMLLQAILAARWRLVVLVGVFLESFRVRRVDCGNDGEVVLELLEMVLARRNGVVKRVDQRWVVWTERELVDVVGEVECCEVPLARATHMTSSNPCLPLWSRCWPISM